MREAPGAPVAEVAFVTADAARGRGIAPLLLAMLIELAPTCGITTFNASVMVENVSMSKVFHRAGYRVTTKADANVRELTIDLTSPVAR
jgi:ribosomal protein S18 acetylase RimI-like enzyme